MGTRRIPAATAEHRCRALLAFRAVPDGFSLLLIVVLVLAVGFDYINGFHDTANAIATSVSTRALRPSHAILMSATANFVGALTGTAVAKTIASGIATTPSGDQGQIVVAAALVGAITWNLITWRLGIPSSSSHALIGGIIGSAVAAAGPQSLNGPGIYDKVLFPLVASPVLTPIDELDMFMWTMRGRESDSAPIAKAYPREALALLNAVISSQREAPPYELPQVLETMATAQPSLRQDSRWIRLNNIGRQDRAA